MPDSTEAVIDSPARGVEDIASETGTPTHNRRLSDKVLGAFNHAYAVGQIDVAANLREILAKLERDRVIAHSQRKANPVALSHADLWVNFVEARNDYREACDDEALDSEELKTMGVHPVKNVSSLRGKKVGAVIVRTHGVTRQVMDSLVSKRYNVIDATCPYVKKAQYYAKLLKDEGYQVVVLGSKEHPEVKGIMSFAEKGAVVVKDASELPKLKQKVGVVVQTTRHVDSLKELLGAIVGQIRELKVYNTLCSSTTLRLKETEELARKVDVMVIVGGKNSANTTQLANLCRSLNVSTHHIETASELRKKWFAGAKRVAISAGASTPDRLINDVKRKSKLIGGRVVDGS